MESRKIMSVGVLLISNCTYIISLLFKQRWNYEIRCITEANKTILIDINNFIEYVFQNYYEADISHEQETVCRQTNELLH